MNHGGKGKPIVFPVLSVFPVVRSLRWMFRQQAFRNNQPLQLVRPAAHDQQIDLLHRSLSIRENFRRINPTADENGRRAALARFMFRAEAAMQTVSTLSGGQLLRAALACVLGGPTPPQFLILDEPTNHLDIESIAEVEAGLRAYDGALLAVSHDEAFLDAIGVTRRVELAPHPG